MLTKENLWTKIKEHEGEIFQTVTGIEFTYVVRGNYIQTSRTDRHLTKKNFENAFDAKPEKVSDITNTIQGSSYVFAILQKLS